MPTRKFDIGDVVRTSAGELAVIREYSARMFAIEPYSRRGVWAWWNAKDFTLISRGPCYKARREYRNEQKATTRRLHDS